MDEDSYETKGTKKKTLVIVTIVIAIAAVAVGAFLLMSSSDDKNNNTTSNINNSQNSATGTSETETLGQSTDTPDAKKYTTEDVAKHNKETDCWTYIDTTVYDITDYVVDHPGGTEILRACGTNGTSLFKERKTTNGEAIGTGTPHSSTASDLLSEFKAGALSQ